MADSLSKYRSVLKHIRKENPKMSFKTAQKKASAAYHDKPVKRKKAVGAKKPAKKSIIKTIKVTSIGKKHKVVAPMQRAVNISKKINDLEAVLKNTSGALAKNHIKRLINAEHDKLDLITKKLKSA